MHYSSGAANHFFYLLAEGTTNGSPSKTCVAGNTRVASGAGSVTGIGRDKAAKIWYRALKVYMTSSTNYSGARAATIKAANDLYGSGGVEAMAVAAAWTAVGRPQTRAGCAPVVREGRASPAFSQRRCCAAA